MRALLASLLVEMSWTVRVCWLAVLPLAGCAPALVVIPTGATTPDVAIPIGAETPEPVVWLSPGQRVRVMMPSAGIGLATATMVGMRGDSIVLAGLAPDTASASRAAGGAQRVLPLAGLGSLEISHGVHGNPVWGAVYGALAGAAAGAALGSAATHDCGSWSFYGFSSDCVYNGGFLGFVAGAGVGAFIGSFVKSEKWERVPLDQLHRLRIGLIPQPAGRLGLGAALAF